MPDPNQQSADYLQQFETEISVSFIEKAQDWKTRQQIQYWAMKALITDDFFGLDDWAEQIQLYSAASAILQTPYNVIKTLVPRNRNVVQDLLNDDELGVVGKELLSIYGFSQVNLHPEEILNGSLLSRL